MSSSPAPAPAALDASVGALHRAHLEELAKKKNTTVLTVEHECTHEPWKPDRVRAVIERIAEVVTSAPESESDFALRKRCMEA